MKSVEECVNGVIHTVNCKKINPIDFEDNEIQSKHKNFETFLKLEQKVNSQQGSLKFTPENLYPDTSNDNWRSEKRFTQVIINVSNYKKTLTSLKKNKNLNVKNSLINDNAFLMNEFTNCTKENNKSGNLTPEVSKNLFGVSVQPLSRNNSKCIFKSNESDFSKLKSNILNPNIIKKEKTKHVISTCTISTKLAPCDPDHLSLNFEGEQLSMSKILRNKRGSTKSIFSSKINNISRFSGRRFGDFSRSRKSSKLSSNMLISKNETLASRGSQMNAINKKKAKKRNRKKERKNYKKKDEYFVIKKDFNLKLYARFNKSIKSLVDPLKNEKKFDYQKHKSTRLISSKGQRIKSDNVLTKQN